MTVAAALPPPSGGPTGAQHLEVRVDLDAISHNVAALCAAAPTAAVMAVVKGDAYGHGLVPSARAAVAGGASWLGTAVLAEAVALRDAGLGGRILCWLATPGEDWASALRRDIDVSAYAPWAVREIADAARVTGTVARLHLKIDTGLGRGGATYADWPELVDTALAAQAQGTVEIVGSFSHFALADAPRHPTTAAQIDAFHEAVDAAASRGATFAVRHLANSAGTLTWPESHLDLVRPGLAVYGLSPIPDQASADELGLRPAMTASAAIALTKRVPAGQGVSYGHEYVTDRPTTLALVPVGYADGLPREAGGVGPMQVKGSRMRIAGRVCMDQVVLDVGDHGVHAGDRAILFGPGDAGEPSAEDWARATGTISYEIVTRFAPRHPRTYVSLDQPGIADPTVNSTDPAIDHPEQEPSG